MKKNTRTKERQYGGVDADTRQKARRDQLIEAGLEAFGTHGFTQSKIKDICQIAGLTERYFYESFSRKEDLLLAVYKALAEDTERSIQALFQRTDLEPESATAESLKLFLENFQNDPRRARIQLFEILSAYPQMARQYHKSMLALIDLIDHICEMLFDFDSQILSKTILSKSMAGAIIEVARGWAAGQMRI